MISCGIVFSKPREIKNGDKCIVLDIYSKLDCLDKREETPSESRDYMGRSGEGLNTSMYLRTKMTNKKQKTRFAITDINNQGFRKFLKKFKNSPYIGYNSKQVNNE